mmetsp:Transcript_13250/g.20715  ORF Transcript_13250/g.20715 Transcript_13250/m.20715 type:complete len:277 (+) Transcript_13250:3073-3903(+)
MVAILSTTYSLMLESGSFMYKCSLFEYCERFMIAFSDIKYGEMVIHAPPVNLLCLVLLPFVPLSNYFGTVSEYFSICNFWIENIIFVSGFIGFELMVAPMIYVITFFNLIYSTSGLFETVYNIFYWGIFGIAYLLILLLRDVYYLLLILYHLDGCKAALPQSAKDIEEEGMPEDKQIEVYNDLRVNVVKMYYEIKKQVKKTTEHADEEVKVDDNFDVLRMLDEDEQHDFEPGLFSVKLTAIHDFWRKSKSKIGGEAEEKKKEEKKEEKKEDAPADA